MPRSRPDRISLLLADVDGTLVDEAKVLTPRAIAAVRALAEAGIGFAITSGRPPRGMAMLTGPLALDTPLAGFNGGVFVNADLSPIQAKTLSRDMAATALEVVTDHGLDAWIYTGEDWLIRDPDGPHVAKERSTVQFDPKVVENFDGQLDEVAKLVGVSDDHDKVKACEAALKEALGDGVSAARSQPYYVDVTHKEANKGFVVGFLSERLGIPADEIVTIGDMANDLEMFEASGYSIAMGNADDNVQGRADYVTAAHTDDGFAKAVETVLLRRGEPE